MASSAKLHEEATSRNAANVGDFNIGLWPSFDLFKGNARFAQQCCHLRFVGISEGTWISFETKIISLQCVREFLLIFADFSRK